MEACGSSSDCLDEELEISMAKLVSPFSWCGDESLQAIEKKHGLFHVGTFDADERAAEEDDSTITSEERRFEFKLHCPSSDVDAVALAEAQMRPNEDLIARVASQDFEVIQTGRVDIQKHSVVDDASRFMLEIGLRSAGESRLQAKLKRPTVPKPDDTETWFKVALSAVIRIQSCRRGFVARRAFIRTMMARYREDLLQQRQSKTKCIDEMARLYLLRDLGDDAHRCHNCDTSALKLHTYMHGLRGTCSVVHRRPSRLDDLSCAGDAFDPSDALDEMRSIIAKAADVDSLFAPLSLMMNKFVHRSAAGLFAESRKLI